MLYSWLRRYTFPVHKDMLEILFHLWQKDLITLIFHIILSQLPFHIHLQQLPPQHLVRTQHTSQAWCWGSAIGWNGLPARCGWQWGLTKIWLLGFWYAVDTYKYNTMRMLCIVTYYAAIRTLLWPLMLGVNWAPMILIDVLWAQGL